jgi:hypothetical protein
MSGKTILSIALLALIVFGAVRYFRSDTSDPSAVLSRYHEYWESRNTIGIYPLLSMRAKGELARMGVGNAADYYSYFAGKRSDLSGFELTSQEIRESNGRFWVSLRFRDDTGKKHQETVTFVLLKEPKGWRVDGWQGGGEYSLP